MEEKLAMELLAALHVPAIVDLVSNGEFSPPKKDPPVMGEIPAGPFGNGLPALCVQHVKVGFIVLQLLLGRRDIPRIHVSGHRSAVEKDLETPARVIPKRELPRAGGDRGREDERGKDGEEAWKQMGGHKVNFTRVPA
jgi:hypothetical protein